MEAFVPSLRVSALLDSYQSSNHIHSARQKLHPNHSQRVYLVINQLLRSAGRPGFDKIIEVAYFYPLLPRMNITWPKQLIDRQ